MWALPLFCVAMHRAPIRFISFKGDVGSIKTVRPGMAEAKLIGTVWIHLGGIVIWFVHLTVVSPFESTLTFNCLSGNDTTLPCRSITAP